MNDRKIGFIFCVNNEQYFLESTKYINELTIPEGYEIEIVRIDNPKSIFKGYNEGILKCDAKYKVYIHQDTFIINKDFIKDILKIFRSDKDIGLIGMVGCEKLTDTCIWWEGICYGKVYECSTGYCKELKFIDINEEYKEVEVVDGLIIVTQYDIDWREDYFSGWHYYDISQCYEFHNKGYKVVIPNQDEPWCLNDCGIVNINNGFEENRRIFIERYYK